MNVAMGGTLIQHLENQTTDHADREARHNVLVKEGSVLARLGRRGGEFTVNTSHHQALKQVAPSLRVTAESDDGVIEAVESTESGRFLVGVQWHPERIWRESDLSRALFEELIKQSG